jgi:ribonuclease BN (tRNA processing enzyme)
VVEFIRNADLIIADSQDDAFEYPSRRGWGHACAEDTVQLAMRAGAKRLALFHHDPDHTDEKITAMVEQAQMDLRQGGGKLIVTAAREGKRLACNHRHYHHSRAPKPFLMSSTTKRL